MSFLTVVGRVLRDIADDYRGHRARKRFLKAFRAEREAKIARGEVPPRFRSYDDYLRSDWWQRLRAHVLSHLSHECEFCGRRATQVHHVRYPRTRGLGTEGIKSLYAVCSRCHDVAHGLGTNNGDSMCAFCRTKATATLAIAIIKHDRSSQRVCRRCDSLANGYRGQANRWAQKYYESWVERWRQTMPPLNRVALSANTESQSIQDDKGHKSQFEETPDAKASRRLVLEERQREFAARSTEELRIQWANRGELDYQDDELQLLRSAIRQRLGYQQ